MGVKSLWSWIDLQPRGSVSRHVVLARSKNSDPAAREATIVVDGFAWMFHLVHVYGGHADMGAVATAAEHEVVALREAGLEPVVVLDGCRSDRKAATTAQRMAQRLRAVQKWVEGLTMPQSNEGEKQHPPHILPMGTTSTVLAVLRACDVRVLVGDHEADGLIESEARNNKSTTVLADDSDFFIADSIGAVASLRSLQVDDDNVQMQVYRPAMVRTALGGLAPDLMPYFSALVGNDYGQLDADVLARVLLALGPPSSNTGIKIRDAIDRVRVVASCLAGFPDAQALLNALANITEPHDLRQAVARLLALADERVQVRTTDPTVRVLTNRMPGLDLPRWVYADRPRAARALPIGQTRERADGRAIETTRLHGRAPRGRRPGDRVAHQPADSCRGLRCRARGVVNDRRRVGCVRVPAQGQQRTRVRHGHGHTDRLGIVSPRPWHGHLSPRFVGFFAQ